MDTDSTIQSRIRVLLWKSNNLIVILLDFLCLNYRANIGHFPCLLQKFSIFSLTKSVKIRLRKPEYYVVMADNGLLISIFPVPQVDCIRTAAVFTTGMFAMVHSDKMVRRRIALFLFAPLGTYIEENLEIQARHGTRQHRKVLFIQ